MWHSDCAATAATICDAASAVEPITTQETDTAIWEIYTTSSTIYYPEETYTTNKTIYHQEDVCVFQGAMMGLGIVLIIFSWM